jgi:hypothetical protein
LADQTLPAGHRQTLFEQDTHRAVLARRGNPIEHVVLELREQSADLAYITSFST